ncbi:putative transcription factor WD40-like family [Helianthus annuus]|nr:putative transcription factor WD40-like family [Helianthus annuus]
MFTTPKTINRLYWVQQDKKINILDIASGQVIRSFKQGGDFGDPNKVCVDPSCSYVVCSYSDKSICMYDITNGEMVARATGHGEAVNGIIFLPDCKHLVSVGSDGCIFVWKVPVLLTSRMLLRIKESSHPLSPNINSQRTAADQIKYYEENYLRSRSAATTMLREGKCPQETPTFRFSISRLPQWAKSKVTSPFVMPMDPIPSEVYITHTHIYRKVYRTKCINVHCVRDSKSHVIHKPGHVLIA